MPKENMTGGGVSPCPSAFASQQLGDRGRVPSPLCASVAFFVKRGSGLQPPQMLGGRVM